MDIAMLCKEKDYMAPSAAGRIIARKPFEPGALGTFYRRKRGT
jgi:hypothetical protein